MADPHSVRAYFQRLIALRKAEAVIQEGDVRFVEGLEGTPVIAFWRTLGETRVLVQCNFSGEEVAALDAEGSEQLIGNYDEPSDVLRPYEARATIWR